MDADRQLVAIAARRWKIAIVLTATMLVTYFGFLLLVAYDKAGLGAVVTPGLSWGILLGAFVIVVAWAVTGVYVHWANRHYDSALDEIRAQRTAPKEQ